MMLSKTLAMAAAVAVPVLATNSECIGTGKLNMYWGQDSSTRRLADYCTYNKPDFITLGFINNSPENDVTGTGYPSLNLAGHCPGIYFVKDGQQSNLLDCAAVQEDVAICQEAGVKILLSIGGWYGPLYGDDYSVKSNETAVEFANFLYGAFGPYQEGSDFPRPLDNGDAHFTVDGFDFDIENRFADQTPYITLINYLRTLSNVSKPDLMLTAAPQCPITSPWMQMDDILSHAVFDALFIQFYNNPAYGCNAGQSGFNYDAWVDFLSSTPNAAAKIYIGLVSSESAGTGALSVEDTQELICEYRDRQNFGGVSLWDAARAYDNMQDGMPYNQYVQYALQCGCDNGGPTPEVTTSSVVSTLTSTSLTSTEAVTTTSAAATTGKEASTSTESSSIASSTAESSSSVTSVAEISSTSIVQSTTTASSTTSSAAKITSTSAALTTSSSAIVSSSSSIASSVELITSISSYVQNTTTSAVLSLSTAVSSFSANTTSSSAEVKTTTSQVASSFVSTTSSSATTTTSSSSSITDNSAVSSSVSFSKVTEETTSSSAATTTLITSYAVPSSFTKAITSTSVSFTAFSSSKIAEKTTSSFIVFTSPAAPLTSSAIVTPIVNSTSVAPVVSSTSVVSSSKASSVAASSSVISTGSTIALSSATGTTSSPATTVSSSALSSGLSRVLSSTSGIFPNATATLAPVKFSTSTAFSTSTYTITSCAPTVTNCPVGKVTTIEVAVSVTVCPVEETASSTIAAETVPGTQMTAAPEVTPEAMTTSTIFSTKVYIVTECAETVTNCPAHTTKVVTDIIAISTTVCPVTTNATTTGSPVGNSVASVPSVSFAHGAQATATTESRAESTPVSTLLSASFSKTLPSSLPIGSSPAAANNAVATEKSATYSSSVSGTPQTFSTHVNVPGAMGTGVSGMGVAVATGSFQTTSAGPVKSIEVLTAGAGRVCGSVGIVLAVVAALM